MRCPSFVGAPPATLDAGSRMDTNIDRIYREESGRILATLIRLLGSFDLAEEVMQEAFATALEQWPKRGMPASPRAWLVSTAHHKAIDLIRRRTRFDSRREELQKIAELEQQFSEADLDMLYGDSSALHDDRLRLIFTCCHPALVQEAQVALTLRTLCGLSTEEIARAFLVPAPTLGQRLVRAKRKIADARIPYQVPSTSELPTRLEAVMLVVYLVFNEGYSASSGDAAIRRELCAEAIRLGRLIYELLPEESEARALLALMLLHHSRRDARTDAHGDVVLLEDQDRSRWDHAMVQEGLALVESALRAGRIGSYGLQASIAAVHAHAARADETDWKQIVALYKVLQRLDPSPVVELNHAAAVAMASGPGEGLLLLDALDGRPELREYYLLPAARADLLRRLGQRADAALAYRRALVLAGNEAARSFLSRRLAEMETTAF
jgi:RNA polymerase sigma-70 factor (ECF subfamily)